MHIYAREFAAYSIITESTYLIMKKFIILSLSLFMGAAASTAQVKLHPTDMSNLLQMQKASELRTRSLNAENNDIDADRTEMLIRYDSRATLDEICANGGLITSDLCKGSAIVSVPLNKVIGAAATKGVKGAILPRLVRPVNNQARIFSKVNEVLAGEGLKSAYDGTGVIVGLFDIGLDPNHINFRDADGNNRVKFWFQYSGSSTKPTEYPTPQAISIVTSDSRSESHGTHVAGIMAGSFKGVESSTLTVDYSGVAPGADIVMSGGPGYNLQILDAVQRIAKYAKEQEKPCVINLSFGDNMGPHDGSDAFTTALNDVAEEYDAVICLAAGNEREEPISIVKTLTAEDPVASTFALKGDYKPTGAGNYFQTYGDIEIWTEDETPFDVTLDIISILNPEEILYSFEIPVGKDAFTAAGNTINSYVSASEATITKNDPLFTKYYTNSFMGGAKGVDEANNRYCAILSLMLNSATRAYGNNTFTRVTVKGEPGKKIFMYCDYEYMNFGNKGLPGVDNPNGCGTNSNMASGTNTICVGSYVSNNIRTSGYPSGTIGDASYFSSWGETPDGRVMPDVCAPGQVIVSSRNSYLSSTSDYDIYASYKDEKTGKTYGWTTCAGTSQASPHMAGICALWRQANPNLTYKDIQEIARTTAADPGFDSPGWGYGKADALAGIKKILGESSVYEIIENAPESILIESAGGNVYDIFAPGEDSVSATVYSLQGVASLSSAANGNSMNLDLSSLPSGIYLLKVTAPHSSRTLKIRK